MSVQKFSTSQGRRKRALAIVAGVLAAEVLWLVAELAFGVRLQAPAGNGSPRPVDIGPGTVTVASAVLSLLGWGGLAMLERFTSRAPGIWLALALLALVVSLTMPLSGTEVSTINRAVLVLMHLTVAGTVIPVMYRISPQAQWPAWRSARVLAGETS